MQLARSHWAVPAQVSGSSLVDLGTGKWKKAFHFATQFVTSCSNFSEIAVALLNIAY